MAQYFTDFSGYSVDSSLDSSSDWSLDIGSSSNFMVRSREDGSQYVEGTNDEESGIAYSPLDPASTPVEVYAEINFVSAYSGALRAGVATLVDGSDAYYAGGNFTGSESLVKRSGSFASGDSLNTGTWYSIRAKRESDGSQYAKFWSRGSSEPSSWTLTATDTEFTSGASGLAHYYITEYNVDTFGVGTDGDAAPTEPVSTSNPPNAPSNLSATIQ